MYKKIISKRGKEMWYNDGKLCKTADVPEELRSQPEYKKEYTGCLFCGMPEEHQRAIRTDGELHQIKLCGDCYFSKTVGEIAEALRRRRD